MDNYFGSTWYLRTDQGTFADCHLDWWPLDETMKFEAEGIYMLVVCSDRAPPDGDEDSEEGWTEGVEDGGGQDQEVVSTKRLPSDGVIEADHSLQTKMEQQSPQEEDRNSFGLLLFPSEDGTYYRVWLWKWWFIEGYENFFDQFEMSEVII